MTIKFEEKRQNHLEKLKMARRLVAEVYLDQSKRELEAQLNSAILNIEKSISDISASTYDEY